MSTCRNCQARGAHYRCASCGMHTLIDSKPCFHCRYFKFEVVSDELALEPGVEAVTQPVTPPVAAQKTKRRQRGAADSTQRD